MLYDVDKTYQIENVTTKYTTVSLLWSNYLEIRSMQT